MKVYEYDQVWMFYLSDRDQISLLAKSEKEAKEKFIKLYPDLKYEWMEYYGADYSNC